MPHVSDEPHIDSVGHLPPHAKLERQGVVRPQISTLLVGVYFVSRHQGDMPRPGHIGHPCDREVEHVGPETLTGVVVGAELEPTRGQEQDVTELHVDVGPVSTKRHRSPDEVTEAKTALLRLALHDDGVGG